MEFFIKRIFDLTTLKIHFQIYENSKVLQKILLGKYCFFIVGN